MPYKFTSSSSFWLVLGLIIALNPLTYASDIKEGKGVKTAKSHTRLYEQGATGLYDGSFEATGKVQADKYFELIGVDTTVVTTPSSNHSRLYLDDTTQRFCAKFDNGSVLCLGTTSGTVSGLAITASDPIIYNSTAGILSLGKVSLATGTAGPYVATVTGTSHQVNVSMSSGTPVFSTPQNIDTNSDPSFNTVSVGSTTSSDSFSVQLVDAGSENCTTVSTTLSNSSSQLSGSFWIKTNSTNKNGEILNKGQATSGKGWQFITVGSGLFRFQIWKAGPSAYQANVINTYNDNNWHNVVFTYDLSGGTTIYIDGASVGTTISGTPGTINDDTVGVRLAHGDNSTEGGNYDDVRLYQRILSPSEVSTLFSGGSPSSVNLIAYWKMEDGSGSTITDSVSGGNDNFTCASPPTWSTSVPSPLSISGSVGKLIFRDLSNPPRILTLKAPTVFTSSYTLVLPDTQGGANSIISNDGIGDLSFTNSYVSSVAGTACRVTISGGIGAVTLSGPQDICTGSSPSFAGLTLSGLSNNTPLVTNGSHQVTTGNISLTSQVTGILPLPNISTSVVYAVTFASAEAQTADIGVSTLTTTPSTATYRVSVYIVDTTADVTAGAVTGHINFTDKVQAQSLATSTVVLTTLGTFTQSTFYIISGTNKPITYNVTHSGLFGTATYSVYISVEKVY